MTSALIPALALLAPPAQVIDYGNQLINPSRNGHFRPLGWSNDEGYYAWDTELNGGGAMATAQRVVLTTRLSRRKLLLHWNEGDDAPEQTWLDAQSSDLFSALGISGNTQGPLIYQFAPSFFLSNHKLKPFSQLKTQYQFTLQGVTYRVVLDQQWEPNWTVVWSEGQPVRYKRAKAAVSVKRGNVTRLIGNTEFSDAAGYAINRIYLSPSRDRIAVDLARFTIVWFEGINMLAEHSTVASFYRE